MAQQTLLLIRHAEKPEDGQPGEDLPRTAWRTNDLSPQKDGKGLAAGPSYSRRPWEGTTLYLGPKRSSLRRLRMVMTARPTMPAAKAVARWRPSRCLPAKLGVTVDLRFSKGQETALAGVLSGPPRNHARVLAA